jgi:hypothetical protein
MAEQKNDQKCAHPSCYCIVPAGTKYCSEYCKKAPQVELALQLHAPRLSGEELTVLAFTSLTPDTSPAHRSARA